MPRAQWKGFLRLSLVTIAVELYNAVEAGAEIGFNLIHAPSGKRVNFTKTVQGIGPVENSDIVKGYPIERDTYVTFTNDEPATATLITTLPAAIQEDTTQATSNSNDPPQSCALVQTSPKPRASTNGKTVWFKHVATFSGLLLAETAGSSYDTVLSAYAGTVSAGTEVGCNDDIGSALQSRMIFPVIAGQTYYIDVSGFGASSGGALSL